MAKRHSWPGRPHTPSNLRCTVCPFSLFLPFLCSIVSPTFLFLNTSLKHGRRRTCPHIQSAASSPPQHLQQQSSTYSSSTSSLRHIRSCTPTSPTRPGSSTNSSAPPRRRHPGCCCARR